MKQNIRYCSTIIVITIMSAISFSCKKFLDKKSGNLVVSPQTLSDLQALLDDANTVMNMAATPSMGEASADDYFLRPASFGVLNTWQQMVYKWTPYAYNHPNDWSYNYAPVYNANYCLDMLANIDRNSANKESWDNINGSAHFYRAYYFLMLAWTFAHSYDETAAVTDMGIVLRKTSDFNSPSHRASVKATYDQIISDAKESVAYLPTTPLHVFRPSKAAA